MPGRASCLCAADNNLARSQDQLCPGKACVHAAAAAHAFPVLQMPLCACKALQPSTCGQGTVLQALKFDFGQRMEVTKLWEREFDQLLDWLLVKVGSSPASRQAQPEDPASSQCKSAGLSFRAGSSSSSSSDMLGSHKCSHRLPV